VEWIRGNVTFSNVAARSLSSTHDVSTATMVKYGKLFEDTWSRIIHFPHSLASG
jgi:hypothetical protein